MLRVNVVSSGFYIQYCFPLPHSNTSTLLCTVQRNIRDALSHYGAAHASDKLSFLQNNESTQRRASSLSPPLHLHILSLLISVQPAGHSVKGGTEDFQRRFATWKPYSKSPGSFLAALRPGGRKLFQGRF